MNPPDPMDRATETEEMFRGLALKARQPAPPPACGRCYNCGSPTDGKFCDADCRDDWELRMNMKRLNGG